MDKEEDEVPELEIVNSNPPPPTLLSEDHTVSQSSLTDRDLTDRDLTDRDLNDQLERNKTYLLNYGPNLPDNGEKISLRIASLEEEKQRRTRQRSEMIHGGGMDDDGVFTWVITDFSTSLTERIDRGVHRSSRQRSVEFLVGGCKWALSLRICQYEKNTKAPKYLFLILEIPDYETLPNGWSRKARVNYTYLNPPPPLSEQEEKSVDFQAGKHERHLINHAKPLKKYLSSGRLLVRVKISDVVANFQSETVVKPVVKAPTEVEASSSSAPAPDHSPIVQDCVYLDGIRVLASHEETARAILLKHIAIPQNPCMKTPCMEILLNIVESICKPEVSEDDIKMVDAAIAFLKIAGMDLNSLEQKVKIVSEKIAEGKTGKTIMSPRLTLHNLFD